jgi:hypothetical protein
VDKAGKPCHLQLLYGNGATILLRKQVMLGKHVFKVKINPAFGGIFDQYAEETTKTAGTGHVQRYTQHSPVIH